MTLKTSLVIGGDAQDAIAALIGFEQRITKAEAAAKRLAGANDDVGVKADKGTRQAQAGYVNLGRQMQDVAVQMQSGTNIGTIIAQQGGQVADAVSQMGGRFSKFAGFLAGPWGAAITVGIGVVLNLAQALWDNQDAADGTADALSKVALASDGLSAAQSVLGQMFDLTTGKMKAQNETLRLNVQLQAIKLRSEALAARSSAQESITDAGQQSWGSVFSSNTPLAWAGRSRNTVARSKLEGVLSGREKDPAAVLKWAEKANFSGVDINREDYIDAVVKATEARAKGATADELEKALSGKLPAMFLKPEKAKRPKRGAADKSAEQAAGIAAQIAGIKDEFSDLPSVIEKSNAALLKLDKLAIHIEGKKGPDYDKMRADIEDARKAINDGLNKPFEDFLEKARAGEQIDKLLIAGKEDQADALQVILGLEEKQKPLNEQQLATVLATVEADRRRAAVLRDQREIIGAQVNAVRDMRGALEQTVANALRGRFSAGAILSSAANSYVDMLSKKTVESLFGDTLRQLEEQASGQAPLRKAAEGMATDLGTSGEAAKDHAAALRAAIDVIHSTGSSNSIFDSASSDAIATAIAAGNAAATDVPSMGPDIVVNGKPQPALDDQTGNLMVSMADKLARQVGIKLPGPIVDSAKKLLGKLETGLPSVLGTAMVGASVGGMVGGGSKGANIGGAIGGVIGKEVGKMAGKAIGGALGKLGGPIGSIAGSILGGLIGGAFSKTKTGTATVGNAGGQAKVTGTSGNNQQRISAARGLASGALSALDQIVEQLNGEMGDFSGSIGIRKSKFVVDPTGAGRTKGAGTQSFATEAEAQQALLANLIADGAVKGVSAAVQRALTSSADVQAGLKEALKVQDLELAIGGIGAQFKKEFRTFERQAAERLRIAREYGFDILKVEEQNAKDRVKLQDKLLAEQIGSLQSLITDMTSGSLFEGSAVDRRQALLGDIDKAKADLAAGTEGAADKLSSLLEQLNSVSKEAFATTGTFAADRASILDQARTAIADANARITEAQKSTDPALETTNAWLSENNDQNARIIAELKASNALFAGLFSGGGSYASLAALAATSAK